MESRKAMKNVTVVVSVIKIDAVTEQRVNSNRMRHALIAMTYAVKIVKFEPRVKNVEHLEENVIWKKCVMVKAHLVQETNILQMVPPAKENRVTRNVLVVFVQAENCNAKVMDQASFQQSNHALVDLTVVNYSVRMLGEHATN